MSRSRLFPFLVLCGGVLVAAISSILVREAQAGGAPSLVVAAWRLTFAVAILTPLSWSRRSGELRQLQRSDILLAGAAGVLLAVHLAVWIWSLEFTSVASSVALVSTNPLWIGLFVYFVFGERLPRYTVIGVAAALAGTILVAFSDSGVLALAQNAWAVQVNWQALLAPAGKSDTALLGDGLALAGGVAEAGYLLIGRRLRARLSTLSYVWVVYTAAMISLLITVFVTGRPMLGYSWQVYLFILLLAIGPQLLAHTSFNWALAHLSTIFVAIIILGEPIGASVFAYFLFGEAFVPVQLVGFVLLLAGIGLGALGEQRIETTPLGIIVGVESVRTDDALTLIRHLSAELGTRYGDDGAGAFSPDDMDAPGAAFVIARVNGQPVGCGALRPMEPGVGEVKRMYVEPDMRGRGLSRQILQKLEDTAREFGYTTLRLETGLKQPEAIGLYETAGYGRIPPYGHYVNSPHSVCFEKALI